MWQIICLCLPAMTKSEQREDTLLLSEVLHACGRMSGEIDTGLFFLHVLSPEEMLTVLEERLNLVTRSHSPQGQEAGQRRWAYASPDDLEAAHAAPNTQVPPVFQ